MYPPFFFLPLGFVIFPYLLNLILKILSKSSVYKLFLYGFFYGFGFLVIYLIWLYNPFLINEITKPYAFLSLLLPLFLSIFFGLGFCLFKYFNTRTLLIIVIPFIFILIEFCISNFLYGFPWISNSYLLSNNYIGFYVIKYFGTFTSGYIITSIFLLTSILIYDFNKNIFYKFVFFNYVPLIITLLILIIFEYSNKDISQKKIKVDAYQIFTPINNQNKKDIQKNIINKINNSKSDFIIFAENNFPYLIDKNDLNEINKLFKKDKKIIIGATTYNKDNYFNSFLLLENNTIKFFDKKILVPFGEFLPFRKYLNFMEAISGSMDFTEGQLERLITTNENYKILPIICYEIIFDKLFKNINLNEVDIIINITNDSWFGNRVGPYQHFYIARVKSLIVNKALLRVSNNGISAFINNNGKIIKHSNLNEIENIKYNLKIKNNMNYKYLHNFFIFYFLIIFYFFGVFFKKKFNNNEL